MNKEMQESDSEEKDAQNSESEDDLFKAVKTERDLDEKATEKKGTLPTLSKNQMKKITAEGPYKGKNVVVFDADG